MVDLSDIGKAGMVIQYEDIVSMIGFNVAKYFYKKGASEKLDSMSIKDVLLSYINREDEDYSKWLNKEFDIQVKPQKMLTSFLTMQPNLMYSYKVFSSSHLENINSSLGNNDDYLASNYQYTHNSASRGRYRPVHRWCERRWLFYARNHTQGKSG